VSIDTTGSTSPRGKTRKHGNGEGTIYHRPNGLWQGRMSLGDGTRKSFYGKTRQEIYSKLAAARRDLDKGLPIRRDERQTVATFLASWLENRRGQIEASTWERYEEYVRLHLVPTLGKTALTKLTAQQVQALYAAKRTGGLSATTVRHLHATLHAALEQALRLGLVQRNVTELVDKPRIVRREMKTWIPEQARMFLATTAGTRLHALYLLALATGMRQGELLALRWRDVDLEHGALSVTASLQRPKSGLKLNPRPKTRSSRRRISLAPELVAILRGHRAVQLAERLSQGELWVDQDLVFCNSIGGPYRSTNLEHHNFKPLVKRAGVPEIRFHDLRHTAATILLLEGVNPKVVSEMLGHASVAITLDLYSHVLPNMQRDAAAAMASVLWGAR
jgi:integrase